MSEGYVIGFRKEETMTDFAVSGMKINPGTDIVISDEGNEYLVKAVSLRKLRENEDTSAYFPLERLAGKADIANASEIKKHDEELLGPVQEEADEEGLKMKVFRIETSLDHEKVKIFYTADERVDFRNLLRALAKMVHARIDMHQVGPRDKAKMTGGLGVCGLPLCCSTFLRAFEGISIAMAKNQMLAINQDKISGQCGKLLCCLRYEDDIYTKEKASYPKINSPFVYEGKNVKVSGFNILSKTVTLLDSTTIKDEETGKTQTIRNYKTITLEEYKAVKEGREYIPEEKERIHPLNESSSLPSASSFGFASSNSYNSANMSLEKKKEGTPLATIALNSSNNRRSNFNSSRKNNSSKYSHNNNSRNHSDDNNPFKGDERWMYHGKNGLKNQNKNKNRNRNSNNKRQFNNNKEDKFSSNKSNQNRGNNKWKNNSNNNRENNRNNSNHNKNNPNYSNSHKNRNNKPNNNFHKKENREQK